MPQRSFRVVIANPTQDLNLTQTFSHLCHGQWTGGWVPPATIPPGGSGGMQSESHGFMTGTQGYVKYAVAQVDQFGANNPLGMIYVYWDNPFFGITNFRFQSALQDVYPNCDFTPPSGVFPPDTTSPVNFGLNFIEYAHGTTGGGDVTNITDLLGFSSAAALGGAAAAIGYLAGLDGIDDHPELDLQVGDVSAPTGPSFGSGSEETTLSLLTDASFEQWAGTWTNGKVRVDIMLTPLIASGRQLIATIQDESAEPPLSLNETFLPGPRNLLNSESSVLGILLQSQARNSGGAAAVALLQSASQTLISAATKVPEMPAIAAARIQKVATNAGATPTAAHAIGQVLPSLITPDTGVAYLSDGIVLHLFGRFWRGKETGVLQLLYQRVSVDGQMIADVMLSQVLIVT
jgi:hypothetical protein